MDLFQTLNDAGSAISAGITSGGVRTFLDSSGQIVEFDDNDILFGRDMEQGYSRSKKFWRDANGNEVFNNSGLPDDQWEKQEAQRGNKLTRAGENERPRNYIQEVELYRRPDDGSLTYRPLDGDGGAAFDDKWFKTFGTRPAGGDKMRRLRVSGVKLTVPWATGDSLLTAARESPFTAQEMAEAGVQENDILSGAEWMRSQVKRNEDWVKSNYGKVGFGESESQRIRTITGREADGVFDFVSGYLTGATQELGKSVGLATPQEQALMYGGSNGLEQLQKRSFVGRLMDALSLGGPLDPDAYKFFGLSDEEQYDYYKKELERTKRLEYLDEVRGKSGWATAGSGAIDMGFYAIDMALSTMLSKGNLVAGTALYTAGHERTNVGEQQADKMTYDPLTGGLTRIAEGREGWSSYVYGAGSGALDYAVEQIGGKLATRAVGAALGSKPVRGLVQKMWGKEMAVALGLAPGVINPAKAGPAARFLGRASQAWNRWVGSNSYVRALERNTGIRVLPSPIGAFEEMSEEVIQNTLGGLLNIEGTAVDEQGRLRALCFDEAGRALVETVKSAPEFFGQMALYSLAMGPLARGAGALRDAYTFKSTARDGLKALGFSDEQIDGMSREEMRRNFMEKVRDDSGAVFEEKRARLLEEARRMNGAGLIGKLHRAGWNMSISQDGETLTYINPFAKEGEAQQEIVVEGADAIREHLLGLYEEQLRREGPDALFAADQMEAISKATMQMLREDLREQVRIISQNELDAPFAWFGNHSGVYDAMKTALALDKLATSTPYLRTLAGNLLQRQSYFVLNSAIREAQAERGEGAAMRVADAISSFKQQYYGIDLESTDIAGEPSVVAFDETDERLAEPGTIHSKDGVNFQSNQDGTFTVWYDGDGANMVRLETLGDGTPVPTRARTLQRSFKTFGEAKTYSDRLATKAAKWKRDRSELVEWANDAARKILGIQDDADPGIEFHEDPFTAGDDVFNMLFNQAIQESGGNVYNAYQIMLRVRGFLGVDGKVRVFLGTNSSRAELFNTLQHELSHEGRMGLGSRGLHKDWMEYSPLLASLSPEEARKTLLDLLRTANVTVRGRLSETLNNLEGKSGQEIDAAIDESLAALAEIMSVKPGLRSTIASKLWNALNKDKKYGELTQKQALEEIRKLTANAFARVYLDRKGGLRRSGVAYTGQDWASKIRSAISAENDIQRIMADIDAANEDLTRRGAARRTVEEANARLRKEAERATAKADEQKAKADEIRKRASELKGTRRAAASRRATQAEERARAFERQARELLDQLVELPAVREQKAMRMARERGLPTPDRTEQERGYVLTRRDLAEAKVAEQRERKRRETRATELRGEATALRDMANAARADAQTLKGKARREALREAAELDLEAEDLMREAMAFEKDFPSGEAVPLGDNSWLPVRRPEDVAAEREREAHRKAAEALEKLATEIKEQLQAARRAEKAEHRKALRQKYDAKRGRYLKQEAEPIGGAPILMPENLYPLSVPPETQARIVAREEQRRDEEFRRLMLEHRLAKIEALASRERAIAEGKRKEYKAELRRKHFTKRGSPIPQVMPSRVGVISLGPQTVGTERMLRAPLRPGPWMPFVVRGSGRPIIMSNGASSADMEYANAKYQEGVRFAERGREAEQEAVQARREGRYAPLALIQAWDSYARAGQSYREAGRPAWESAANAANRRIEGMIGEILSQEPTGDAKQDGDRFAAAVTITMAKFAEETTRMVTNALVRIPSMQRAKAGAALVSAISSISRALTRNKSAWAATAEETWMALMREAMQFYDGTPSKIPSAVEDAAWGITNAIEEAKAKAPQLSKLAEAVPEAEQTVERIVEETIQGTDQPQEAQETQTLEAPPLEPIAENGDAEGQTQAVENAVAQEDDSASKDASVNMDGTDGQEQSSAMPSQANEPKSEYEIRNDLDETLDDIDDDYKETLSYRRDDNGNFVSDDYDTVFANWKPIDVGVDGAAVATVFSDDNADIEHDEENFAENQSLALEVVANLGDAVMAYSPLYMYRDRNTLHMYGVHVPDIAEHLSDHGIDVRTNVRSIDNLIEKGAKRRGEEVSEDNYHLSVSGTNKAKRIDDTIRTVLETINRALVTDENGELRVYTTPAMREVEDAEAFAKRREEEAQERDRNRANAISEWEERTGLLYVPWEERSKLGPDAVLPKREPQEPVPEQVDQVQQEEQEQTQQELDTYKPQEMTDEEAADAFARQAEAELEEEAQADTDNTPEVSVGEPADVPLTDGSKAPSPLALAELSPDARMYRKPLEKVGDFGKVSISDTGVTQFASGVPVALKRIKGLPADAVVISDTGKMMAATDDSASLLAQAAGVSLRHMPDNKTFAIVPSDDGRAAVQSLLSSGYDIVTVSKDGAVTVTQGKRMTAKDVERAAKQRKRFEEEADYLAEQAREGGTSAMMSVGANPAERERAKREMEEVRRKYWDTDAWMKAPNGKPTNLTERQWLQVRTPSFKAWFGDWENEPEEASQMVDRNGEPKVYYHGTPSSSFTAFDENRNGSASNAGWLGRGFYFTDSYRYAQHYKRDVNGSVMEVFLNIRNPYFVSYDETSRLAEADNMEASKAFTEALMDDGYDGAYFREDQEEIAVFDPTAIKSATDNIGTFSADTPDIRMSVGVGAHRPRPEESVPAGTAERSEGAWRWLRRKFINDQAPLFDGIRRVMGDREFADGTDVEASAKNVHGRIRARQERLQRRYVNRILEMLSAPGMSRDTFNSYAMALHALERNAMIRDRSTLVDPTTGHIIDPGVDAGSGMGDLEAQDIIERVERGPFAEGYRRAAELLAEMNREVLDGAVRDGILSAAQAETWKRMSPHYVPLKDAYTPTGSFSHRATGRFSRAADVFANSLRQAYDTIRNGEMNNVKRTMARWVSQYDDAGEKLGGVLLEGNPRHARIQMADPQFVPKDSPSVAFLRERGTNLVETPDGTGYWVDSGVLPDALKRVLRRESPSGRNVVTFWEDGKRKHILFSGRRDARDNAMNEAARVSDALNHANLTRTTMMWGPARRAWMGLQSLVRWKANVSTSWNPNFIVRNMGNDLYTTASIMMLEGKYRELRETMRNYPAALRTVFNRNVRERELGNERLEKYLDEAMNAGAFTGTFSMGSFEDFDRSIQDALRDIADVDGETFLKGGAMRVQRQLRSLGKSIDKLGSVPEMGMRLAVYAALRDNGWKVKDAALYAREITVDFNAKGELTPFLNTLYMFSNATAQSFARILKAAKTGIDEHGVERTLTPVIMMNLMIGFVAEALLNGGGDDGDDGREGTIGDNIPEWERTENVAIPLGQNHYLRLPVRGAMSPIVYLGGQLNRVMSGKVTADEALVKFAQAFAQANLNFAGNSPTLAQQIAPTALDPFVQILEGVDWAGNPLYRETYGAATSDASSGKAGTEDVYKMLAEALNVATGGDEVRRGVADVRPETIKTLVEFALGSIATSVSGVGRMAVTAGNGGRLRTNDIPAVGGVVREVPDHSGRFYREQKRVDDIIAQESMYSSLLKDAEARDDRARYRSEIRSLRERNPWLSRKASLRKMADRVASLRKQETNAETLGKAERAEEIKRNRLALMGRYLKILE